VVKEAEKTEQSKGKQAIGREDRGEQINKQDGSWKTQRVEKSTNRCFGASSGKDGKTGWRNSEKVGQVDLGF